MQDCGTLTRQFVRRKECLCRQVQASLQEKTVSLACPKQPLHNHLAYLLAREVHDLYQQLLSDYHSMLVEVRRDRLRF